jgi:hypothetical protein
MALILVSSVWGMITGMGGIGFVDVHLLSHVLYYDNRPLA